MSMRLFLIELDPHLDASLAKVFLLTPARLQCENRGQLKMKESGLVYCMAWLSFQRS